MILPFKIRENKGSFVMTLPKSIALDLEIDKHTHKNRSMNLISETTGNGVLLRYPTEEEIKRFGILNELCE